MKLVLKKYKEQLEEWPKSGKHILAQYDDEKIIVYQSYRKSIGEFAEKNQYFGGDFSLSRMTWIKPNFLWMMYRNGWGKKEGQEVVLAIHLKKTAFETYLENAVISTFDKNNFSSKEKWQNDLKNSSVRLQWDPDHDPFGNKVERRAIQIGIRDSFSLSYSKDDILEIENISTFVAEQFENVQANLLDNLMVPLEKPLIFDNNELNLKLGLNEK